MTTFKFTVNPHMCEYRFVGWRRTNRNNRIARKWRKRYGAVTACRQDKGFQVGGRFILCPHAFAAILKQTGGKHDGVRADWGW